MKKSKRLLTSRQTRERLGLYAPSSFWEFRRKHPDFPKPIQLNSRTNRYEEDAVDNWIARRHAAAQTAAN